MKLFLTLCVSVIIFFGCTKETSNPTTSIIPDKVTVDIPKSLSYTSSTKSLKPTDESISGNAIYGALGVYISIGKSSAELLKLYLTAIKAYGINKPIEFEYLNNDDSRTKKLAVTEKAVFNNKTYDYLLTITDKELNKTALKLYWNTSPVEAVAFISPYISDYRTANAHKPDLMIKINYSAIAQNGYDEHMIVDITGNKPELNNLTDKWYVSNLKLYVGRSGDNIEIYGNSIHPTAQLLDITNNQGFSYSFVGRANRVKEIAVAKIALPYTNLASNDALFTKYAIDSVFTREILNINKLDLSNPTNKDAVETYIRTLVKNAKAPGFFNSAGFIQSETKPTANAADFTDSFIDLSGLKPYIPVDIKNLKIEFPQ